jgi:hypothetical protein
MPWLRRMSQTVLGESVAKHLQLAVDALVAPARVLLGPGAGRAPVPPKPSAALSVPKTQFREDRRLDERARFQK